MINKPFDQIDKAELINLVSSEVREGRMLEYKETLPGSSDSEKTEFLADVSSLANAAGGYILYGFRERRDEGGKPTGIPDSITGLEGINPDSEILRLESSIRTGLAPRVPGVRAKAVEVFPNSIVLVLWIPKSWSSPHLVIYKNHSRFYSRSSNGKYALDVNEIRSAFATSEGLPEKIRNFRDTRIAKVIANEMPVPLVELPKVILHLVPMTSLTVTQQFDVGEIYAKRQQLESIASGSTTHRINFDGVVTYCFDSNPAICDSYVQGFRNGIIEAIETAEFGESNGNRFIRSLALEKDLISAAARFLRLQEGLGISPPIFLMITLSGVKGYTMATQSDYRSMRNSAIDRDILFLPEITVEQFDQETSSLLRPAFDAVWQAAGFLRRAYYDVAGNWKLPS
jgi:Putative DNA-binding domain